MALSKTLISGWGTLGGGWLISHNVTSSHSLFMCMYGWEGEKNIKSHTFIPSFTGTDS